jgi:hypothetical protein
MLIQILKLSPVECPWAGLGAQAGGSQVTLVLGASWATPFGI